MRPYSIPTTKMTRVFTTVVLLVVLQASSMLASPSKIDHFERTGGNITLKCCSVFHDCTKRPPSLEVTWFRNQKALKVGDGTGFVVNGASLSFPDRASYEAVYQCLGNSSENQGKEVTATLRLEDPLPKQRLYVAENASLTLNCPIEVGNITKNIDNAMIKWTLYDCEGCKDTYTNSTPLKSRVLNLPDEDVAQWTYMCELVIFHNNMIESPKWKWNLIVYKPLVASINASETVYSRAGGNVALECSATLPTNDSSITYSWYREGNKDSLSTNSHLILKNVTLAQSGEYRCTAHVSLDNDTHLEANATVKLLIVGNITKFQLDECPASGNGTLEFSSLPNEAEVEAKVDGDDKRIPLHCRRNECKFTVEAFESISFIVYIGNNSWNLASYPAPECGEKEDEVELIIQLESCPDQRDLDQEKLAKFLREKCKSTEAQVCPRVSVTRLSCSNGLVTASVRGHNVLLQINQTCDQIKTGELYHRKVKSCNSKTKPSQVPLDIYMVLIKVLCALVGVLIMTATVLISLLLIKILKKKCPRQNDLEAQREPNDVVLTEQYRRDDNLSYLNEHASLPHQVELADQTPSLPSYNTAIGGNKTSSRRSRDKTPSDNQYREPSQGAQSKCSKQSCHSCSCSGNSQRFIQLSENSGIVAPLQIPRHPGIDTRTTAVVLIPVREQAVHLPYTTCSSKTDRPFHSL